VLPPLKFLQALNCIFSETYSAGRPQVGLCPIFLVVVCYVCCSPVCPAEMDWSALYPKFFEQSAESSSTASSDVQFADIGCGYGGLLGNFFDKEL